MNHGSTDQRVSLPGIWDLISHIPSDDRDTWLSMEKKRRHYSINGLVAPQITLLPR
jgi:hypothetical protein